VAAWIAGSDATPQSNRRPISVTPLEYSPMADQCNPWSTWNPVKCEPAGDLPAVPAE